MVNSNPLSIKDIINEMFGPNFHNLTKIGSDFDVDKHWIELQKRIEEREKENKKKEKIKNKENQNSFRSECGKILTEILNILDKKNQDYGDSFDEIYATHGLYYAIPKLQEKINRANNLVKNNQGLNYKPNYESLKDTLIDIIGYCTLTLRYL